MDSKNIINSNLVTTVSPQKKGKRELLNVLKMYSPAVIALNDVFFGNSSKPKNETVKTETAKINNLSKEYI